MSLPVGVFAKIRATIHENARLTAWPRRRALRVLVAGALAIVAVSAARPVAAQEMMNKESTAEVRKQFLNDLDTLQSKFLALANAIPADKYSWRPAPGVRSIGEAFMHVASEYYVYTPMAYGLPRSPLIPQSKEGFETFEKASTQADVKKHLTEGFAFMRKSIADADINSLTGTRKIFGGNHTIAETTLIMSGDLHEHMGQLISYARMNGIKPPWSK